jgi:hypothetical protein
MNQVPWRRILERAADDVPGERGASVINLRDHAPARQQNPRRPEPAASSDLESELKLALDRAQRKERDHASRSAPQRGPRSVPPELRSAPMLRPDLAMQRQAAIAVPPPIPQQKKASGARNFLAISLSAAVIGFAMYQIGNQWREVNQAPAAADADIPDRFAAVVAGGSGIRVDTAAPANDSQSRTAAVEGNRIDLRPSFAEEAKTPPRTRAESDRSAALNRDIAQAAKLMKRGEPQRADAAPATPAAATAPANNQDMEQIMLRRGNDMVKQGRVESARLVFEHLAEQKSALGAFALAQLYDAKYLAERNITSVAADQKLAAQWYERAAELTIAGTR